MKNSIRLAAALLLSLLICAAAASLGSAGIGLWDTLRVLALKVFGGEGPADLDGRIVSIVWLLRLPRVLLAFMAGGSLAIAGAVTQSLLQNPLASPHILGVSSGASLGAGLVIVGGLSLPFLGPFTLPLAGFVFALISIFVVIAFSFGVDSALSNNTIILCGMVFSLFTGALLTILGAVFSDDLKRIVLWQMGSFSMRGWLYVKLMLPFFGIAAAGIMGHTRELDLLSFGDDEAKSAGVEAGAVRTRLLFFAAILAGAAVSLSGLIGFVDLMAPHAARKITGPAHRFLIPMSFMTGGSLMVAADLAARTVLSPSELPVGAVTALIGAPFFAWLYLRRGRPGAAEGARRA